MRSWQEGLTHTPQGSFPGLLTAGLTERTQELIPLRLDRGTYLFRGALETPGGKVGV